MEEHLLERCAEEVLRFGRKPLFVCNDTTFEIAYDKVAGSLRSAGVEPKVLKYNGFCCREIALDHARAGAIDGIDLVIGCGDLARAIAGGAREGGAQAMYFEKKEALIPALPEIIRPGDSVLVKASLRMAFDRIVAALEAMQARKDQ
jgi:hypothetical protein